jgi:hypothetical protein
LACNKLGLHWDFLAVLRMAEAILSPTFQASDSKRRFSFAPSCSLATRVQC